MIAVTGYGQQADRASAAAAGFDAHLVKPMKFDQLAQLLERPDTIVVDDTHVRNPEREEELA